MLFKDYHIPEIRSGSKTETRRDWASGYTGPNVGSTVMAASASMVPESAEHNSPMLLKKEDCDCFIKIASHHQEPLGEITTEQAQREGDYETVEEFQEAWIKINGSWNPAMIVDVVGFEYVGREDPAEQSGEAVVT